MTAGDLLTSARAMAEQPDLVQCLWLVKNGIPFDVAFSLAPDERLAWTVILSGFEGAAFDWETGEWLPRK